jgi:hypothetical protein
MFLPYDPRPYTSPSCCQLLGPERQPIQPTPTARDPTPCHRAANRLCVLGCRAKPTAQICNFRHPPRRHTKECPDPAIKKRPEPLSRPRTPSLSNANNASPPPPSPPPPPPPHPPLPPPSQSNASRSRQHCPKPAAHFWRREWGPRRCTAAS